MRSMQGAVQDAQRPWEFTRVAERGAVMVVSLAQLG